MKMAVQVERTPEHGYSTHKPKSMSRRRSHDLIVPETSPSATHGAAQISLTHKQIPTATQTDMSALSKVFRGRSLRSLLGLLGLFGMTVWQWYGGLVS